MHYPAISTKPMRGDERIRDANGDPVASIASYWGWAHSNLMDNTERGAYAEYLVRLAVGTNAPVRNQWDAFDIETPEGIRIEVKTSGYIQSWAQERPSAIRFSIRPARGWNGATGTYAATALRQSDVYVFCLLANADQSTVDPLDLSQWNFYVLPTKDLNLKLGSQKTISLSGILRLGARMVAFGELRKTILEAVK
ncbi:MAG: hypothetical protein IJ074_08435 [Clostridia bacterium]|nr:hypothetical protein [Clostridia bacterium]